MLSEIRLTVALAAGATLLVFASSASAAVLYDQTTGTSGSSDVTSQKFADQPTFSAQAADDFTVPAGQTWALSEVDVLGQTTGSAAPVNVFVYANAGSLPGAQLFAQQDVVGAGFPNYTLPLSAGPRLGPGTYWVSVQEDGTFSANGQWYWDNVAPASGHPAAWQNPGGGFAAGCPTWGVRKTCLPANAAQPDQAFRLLGTVLHTVTVIKGGAGSGTVTSAPVGISCGSTCVAPFDPAHPVTLTATPSAGSVFAGWSGACSGTAQCVISPSADTIVRASFAPAPPPSNSFRIAKLKLNRRKGTARLTVVLPGPGVLTLLGRKLKHSMRVGVAFARSVTLTIKVGGKAKARLRRHHKLRLALTLTFTPNGGSAASQHPSVTLKLKH